MATFVIVHGAFGGGWEWTPVARLLRGMGHEVFTPTLTGFGERFHLGPGVGLATNIEELVALMEFEDLRDVVLCAASYGGMAATGAADRAADRISLLIYIDALVPRNGESGLDLLPATFADYVRPMADESGHGWAPIPPSILPPEGLIAAEVRAHYVSRLRPQPIATFYEPVRLTGTVEGLRRIFVRCTLNPINVGGDPIEPMAARVRESGWPYRELTAPHDPHLFDPEGTAALLHELATTSG